MKFALLLIDLQDESNDPKNKWIYVKNFEKILKKTKILLDKCGGKIPIIYSRFIRRSSADCERFEPRPPIYSIEGTKGAEICELIKPAKGDYVFNRTRYSCFYNTELDKLLKKLKVDALAIAGVLTNACVLATILDAYFRDYKVVLIEDCCGAAPSKSYHNWTIKNLDFILWGFEAISSEEFIKKYLPKLSD